MPTTAASPVRSIRIGRCFDEAMAVYQRNFLTLFLAALLVDILVTLSLLILAGPLAGGVCLMSLRGMRGERVRLGDLFGVFDRFFPLLGLFILSFVAVLLGLALFVLPALILMTLWLYPYYLVADKRMRVFDALGTSTRLVTGGGFWRHVGLMALGLALAVGPLLIPYAGIVVGWLLTPLGWLIVASAYLQLVEPDRAPPADSASESAAPSIGPDV